VPFFSVLIPSYNRPEFIGAAVQSVLGGDFSDFELIISDDKSPRQDEVAAVLAPFTRDPRVKVHMQPVNLREATNRDFLLQSARGEWQIILCDDDRLYPQALSTLARAVREFPGALIYAFGYTVIDEHDRPAYSRRAPEPLSVSAASARLAEAMLVSDAFPFWLFHPATFCSHKSVRERIKPNPDVGIGDDLMFLIDYLNSGEVLQILPAVLMYYRKITAGNPALQGNQSAGELPNLISRARILQHLRARGDLQPTIASIVNRPAFQRRLLFAPIIWSGVPLVELFPLLQLSPELKRDLITFARWRPRAAYKLLLTFRRAMFFLSLFGIAGIRELISVCLSRRAFSRANRLQTHN
jgi:glycosyltransferase involved in cell wall biosynthesis